MKTTHKLIFMAALVMLAISVSSPAQQREKTIQMSPERLVSDLYRQHKKRSPFFQRTNRALLDKYFQKDLADLIWKDALTSGDEVGALDGDPLFNAQDMDIKHFVVHPAAYPAASGPNRSRPLPPPSQASVEVTFENLGQKHSVNFEMNRSRAGWKIADIHYDDSTRLRAILEGTH